MKSLIIKSKLLILAALGATILIIGYEENQLANDTYTDNTAKYIASQQANQTIAPSKVSQQANQTIAPNKNLVTNTNPATQAHADKTHYVLSTNTHPVLSTVQNSLTTTHNTLSAMASPIPLLRNLTGIMQNGTVTHPQKMPQTTTPAASNNNTNYDQTETLSNNNSIWSKISDELKLDHHANSAQVKAEIRKLLADQDEFHRTLSAARPYIYFIHKQTKARGLPTELALIPVIESQFNPNDRSKKGATGLWQLMPGTAHELGVKVRNGYDGRRNIVDSTKAALNYFNDLGNLFKGNWYLAIAAYNCGQGKVASAQRHAGSHNFWDLRLPKETEYYVPRLLAVAEIIKNPDKYGVSLPSINDEPYFSEIKVKKPVTLDQVSKSSGINMNTLSKLNPDFKGKKVPTNKNGAHTLLIPANKVNDVKAQLGVPVSVSTNIQGAAQNPANADNIVSANADNLAGTNASSTNASSTNSTNGKDARLVSSHAKLKSIYKNKKSYDAAHHFNLASNKLVPDMSYANQYIH